MILNIEYIYLFNKFYKYKSEYYLLFYFIFIFFFRVISFYTIDIRHREVNCLIHSCHLNIGFLIVLIDPCFLENIGWKSLKSVGLDIFMSYVDIDKDYDMEGLNT
jgi:hypothetical protein